MVGLVWWIRDVGLVRGRLWGERGEKEERGAEGGKGREGKGVAVSIHTHLNKKNLVVGSIWLVRGPRLGLRLGIENVSFFFFILKDV